MRPSSVCQSHAVDGDDVVEVHEAACRAIDQARAGGGPSFVESRKRTAGAATTRERRATLGRTASLRRVPDPIDRLEQRLSAAGVDARALRARIEVEEEALVTQALGCRAGRAGTARRAGPRGRVRMTSVAAPSSAQRLAPALADGIAHCMRADHRVHVWGEDVCIGVMGPTRGLVDEFGRHRVIDCPISEAAFVGAAIGAAVGGLRPVVDIMFSSFAYVAFDQLANQAGRLRYMTGGQVRLPLVLVGSAGAAGANAAQHSEVPSALFLQAGGLRVLFPSTPHQAFWLMQGAIRSDDPVIVLHHPALGSTRGKVESEPLSRRGRRRSRRDGRLGVCERPHGPPGARPPRTRRRGRLDRGRRRL